MFICINRNREKQTNLYVSAPETVGSVHQKNDPLLSLLKSVYVESTDPAAEVRTYERFGVHFCYNTSNLQWDVLH